METLIPSTPPPSGNPASACGQAGQPGSPDAAASPGGLFQQILATSCAARPAGNGNPEGATSEGQDANAGTDDAGAGETASAESGAPAVFLVVAPPAPAGSGAPVAADGTASTGTPPADPSAAAAVSAVAAAPAGFSAAALQQGASSAPMGASAERSSESADINAAANSAAKDVPVEAAPAGAVPAGAARTDAPTNDIGSSAPAVAPAAEPVVKAAGKPAADPSGLAAGVAAKDAPPAPQAGLSAPAEGEPPADRTAPPSAAPREAKPSAAPPVPDGNPSLAQGEGDKGNALSDGKWEREIARAAESYGKKKEEAAFLAQDPADPGAPPAVSADRDAAGKTSPLRTAVPAPPAAPAPKPLQVGENAFVLTRKGDNSVEVTLSPPGIGKLEIEVVLDKGIINANITAADPAGRDAITRSLPQILEALARDGMAIGGFTVSLKQRKDQAADAPAGRASGNAPARAAAPAAVRPAAASTGLVDLFV